MQTSVSLPSGKSAWSIIFYVLAVLILIIGIYLAISVFSALNVIHSMLPPGLGGPLLDMFLKPVLQQIGALVLVFTVLLSAALAGLGRLVANNAKLRRRVAELEAVVAGGRVG